jgi:hypothetical protein
MNKFFLVLGALTLSALLVPGDADARRGGGGGGFRGGGGGARISGGFGGGGGFGGHRMYMPRGSMGSHRLASSGRHFGGAVAARPGHLPARVAGNHLGTGSIRQVAINNPGGRFDNRFGNGRFDNRLPGYNGRYPYYGGRYPYYGRYGRYPYYGRYYGSNYPYYGYGGWGTGLVTGSILGAAATYPYYNYPYSTYQTPVSSASGGYCATSVRTCALINSAPVGTGCSCRTQGGRARGTVVGL